MIKILQGDCIDGLRTLPDASVHCVVTSPPYWGLRDYGQDGQIGLEETPEAYVARMVEVFREVRRVLRYDGTCWLNLGDSYAAQRSGSTPPAETLAGGVNGWTEEGGRTNRDRHEGYNPSRNASAIGLKHKDLVGIPWRVAFALQADGWWLRQDIIWHKPNPMPESVTDRCTKAHEYVFLLTKSARYFYDAEAVKEESSYLVTADRPASGEYSVGSGRNDDGSHRSGGFVTGSTRNKRSVWTVTTKPFSGAHFAVMPPDLVEPCLLAGTSEKGCCVECGAPWERVVEREKPPEVARSQDAKRIGMAGRNDNERRMGAQLQKFYDDNPSRTIGWRPTCTCGASLAPCTVLDPFGGAGTTALVADRLGRDAIMCELNPEYVKIAEERLRDDNPMFTEVEVHAIEQAAPKA